jgi:hypothetical protein
VIASVGEHALTITGFVFVMMLLIEYVNVQTSGRWQHALQRGRWRQYLLASLLGAMPGCLGAFTVVSLYTHRVVGFGALVATMIATSGDEAYVMLSLFPPKAVLLISVLFAIGVCAGFVTDLAYRRSGRPLESGEHALELHPSDACRSFPRQEIIRQIRAMSLPRALLIGILATFVVLLVTGAAGPAQWDWIKVSLLASALFALFVVSTVPDHFLEHHLWDHVLKRHLLRIFVWTFGALLAIHLLEGYVDLGVWIRGNIFATLVIASLVGLIPESGPHLVFVTLFAQGTIPFSVLLANSIVQDGHGTLPLLASSKRGFVGVKLVNLVVGLALGALAFAVGW